MTKSKLRGYTKSYLGHSDDFEFVIKNNEYAEIAGNYGQETFQGISFEIFLMEYCIWNPESYNLTRIQQLRRDGKRRDRPPPEIKQQEE